MLLGITVSLVGVAVASLYSAGNAQKSPLPRMDLKASALSSGVINGTVTLMHAGGAEFNRSDLDIRVTSGSTLYGDDKFPGAGAWDIGNTTTFALAKPLVGGEHLEIQVISKKLGAVLSSTVVDVPPAAAIAPPAGTFVVTGVTPPPASAPDVEPGSIVRIVAHVTHPEGRKAIESVWVDMSPLGGSPQTTLADAGTNGDSFAGDMDYSGYVAIPPEAQQSANATPLSLGARDVGGFLATPGPGSQVSVHVVPSSLLVSGNLTNFTTGNINTLSGQNVTNVTVSNNVQNFAGDNVSSVTTGGDINNFSSTDVTNVTIEGDTNIFNTTTVQQVQVAGNVTQFNASNVTTVNIGGDINNLTLTSNLTQDELQQLLANTTTNVTIVNNGGVNGPPQVREPDPLSTYTTPGNTLVKVFGQNFSFVNSLRLVNASGASSAAAWWIVNDSEIDLIAPALAAPDDFNVNVTNPVGSSQTVETLHVGLPLVGPATPPTITSMTPTNGTAGYDVKLTGTNLAYASTVRLTSGSLVFAAAFYTVGAAGTELHFIVPYGIIPTTYTVTVSDPGGSASAPQLFTVDPLPKGPPLTIADFNPKSGPPFTQVNLTGTGFLNVVAANIGGANVAMWVINDTSMSVLTTPAVPVQRFNHITVFNLTGSADICCYNETALAQNEYAVYPPENFSRVAFSMTKFVSNSSIGVSLKFNMTSYQFVSGGETFTFSGVALQSPNFKPGSAQTTSGTTGVLGLSGGQLTGTFRTVCSPSGTIKNGVWNDYFVQAPQKYSPTTDTLPFLFWFEWTGSAGHVFDLNIGSSTSQTQDFTFGPQAMTKIVKDGPNYDWPSSFNDCSNTP